MEGVASLRQAREQVSQMLRTHGGLGALLVDMTPLDRIERSFGGDAYTVLRGQLEEMMLELKKQVRADDLLTRDDRHSERFIFFLSAPREGGGAFVASDLRKLADRVEEFVVARVGRLTLPYLRDKPSVGVGYAFGIHSPLESDERQILRLLEDARQSAELRGRLREQTQREALIEVIYNQRLWTVFQPIYEIETLGVMGYEALSRGPRGTELQSAGALFGLAAQHDLTDELERCCRRKALVEWEAFGSPGRLFLNTVRATIQDPSFLGRGVFDYLGPNLSPRMITLEITEREVIENLNLFRQAMHAFIELGFNFAIDDVGKGYSGLETIASLGASYLKIDMSLVRDVHQKQVSQQIVKAIHEMGQGVGASVIAEGIEKQEELQTLKDLGLRYAQGYLFGQPINPAADR